MNKFTEPVREALHAAHSFAGEFIGTEHLLLALAHGRGVASRVLAQRALSADRLEAVVARGADGPSGSIPFSPGAKRVLELALGEALDRGDENIGTAHVLLALLREDTETAASMAVRSAGVDWPGLRRSVAEALAAGESDEEQ